MRSLLLATDYSDNSIAALKLAGRLQKKFGAKLYVMHVFDISATFISTVSIAYARMEEAAFKEHRGRLTEFASEHLDSTDFEVIISENSIAANAIMEKAEELKPDLILAGMRGHNVVREFIMGSTASALIEKSLIPVLCVPSGFEAEKIEKIVYATAFEEADIDAIQKLIPLVKTFGATLNLVHISTQKEYAGEDQLQWFKEMLGEKIDYKELQIELRFADDIFVALNTYLDQEAPQLLVMLEREGQHLMGSLWHRDLVKRMKLEVDIPLMSFHKKGLLQAQT